MEQIGKEETQHLSEELSALSRKQSHALQLAAYIKCPDKKRQLTISARERISELNILLGKSRLP